jgi:pimeloyl-ACP methyl ester carboxylesterase
MKKSSSIFWFTLFAASHLFVGRAEVISDRITVTVHGHGPDVVLIPGLASSSALWDATVSRFEKNYRLHVVQVAGFAGSPARANAEGVIIQPTVDAIDAYIKTNHLKAPRIIGHSLGGLMAMMLAMRHSEDAGGLMVVDSFPFSGVLQGASDVAAAAAPAAAMRDMILKETQDAYAQGEKDFLRVLVKSTDGRKAAIDWAIASDKSVVARAMYEVMTTDLRAKLGEIKIPVTMLYPWDDSSSFPQSASDKLYQENFASLPNKTLVRIEGSYHFIMLDQPEKFAARVEIFLK